MTDYYVDTINGSSGNDGLTPETAFKSIADILGALPEGDHTLYCTGGADLIPGPLGGEVTTGAIGAASSATVVGDWSGFDVNEDCYYITRSAMNIYGYTIVGGPGVDKRITFDRIKIMSDPASYATNEFNIISGVGGGLIEFNNSCAVSSMSAPCTFPYVVFLAANAQLYAVNSVFAFGSLLSGATASFRVLRAAGSTYPLHVSNCIMSPGTDANVLDMTYGVNAGAAQVTNCVMLGRASSSTAKNCVVTGVVNGGVADGGSTLPLADIKSWYVDAEGGNFTPVDLEAGPTALVDEGIDYSANVSSLDINGNDRNDPKAGVAWDIGPYEWGFAAEPPTGGGSNVIGGAFRTLGAPSAPTYPDRRVTIDRPYTADLSAGWKFSDGSDFTIDALPTGLSMSTAGIVTGTPTVLPEVTVSTVSHMGLSSNAFTWTVVTRPPSGTLADAKFDALRDQGFTGSISDMTLQWLQANGATSGSITDAWLEVLPGTGQRNDRWYTVLGGMGYTGSLNDREFAFWVDGGVLPARGLDSGPITLEAILISEGWGVTRTGEDFVVRSGVHEWRFTWSEAEAGVYEQDLPAPLRNDIDDSFGR